MKKEKQYCTSCESEKPMVLTGKITFTLPQSKEYKCLDCKFKILIKEKVDEESI